MPPGGHSPSSSAGSAMGVVRVWVIATGSPSAHPCFPDSRAAGFSARRQWAPQSVSYTEQAGGGLWVASPAAAARFRRGRRHFRSSAPRAAAARAGTPGRVWCAAQEAPLSPHNRPGLQPLPPPSPPYSGSGPGLRRATLTSFIPTVKAQPWLPDPRVVSNSVSPVKGQKPGFPAASLRCSVLNSALH
ncbi:SKI family transcriptional corepressor 1-like [Nomascus leucogenys]|uniref:SKI family transcriptional corepressor 1-like n=1 Tax=Nomascus leucogenys TaxID=61853 RepID=UPI00122D5AE6|nr:SKI family transcriptional corepressor 1-like [Nomascus leucogenys]